MATNSENGKNSTSESTNTEEPTTETNPGNLNASDSSLPYGLKEIPPPPPSLKERKGKGTGSGPRSNRVGDEEKQNRKQKRTENKKRFLESEVKNGNLTWVNAVRIARRAGITLEGDYEPSDDPSLMSKTQVIEKNRKNTNNRIPLLANEKECIISQLKSGANRQLACVTCSIGYQRFLRQLMEDEEFRVQVYTIEQSNLGVCEMVVFGAAVEGDVNAAGRYVSMRANREDGKFKRKLALAEYKLKEMAVQKQLETLEPQPRPSFSCLNDAELIDYEELNNKVKSAIELTANELQRLGFYYAKLTQANLPKPAAPVVDFVAQVASEPLNIPELSSE